MDQLCIFHFFLLLISDISIYRRQCKDFKARIKGLMTKFQDELSEGWTWGMVYLVMEMTPKIHLGVMQVFCSMLLITHALASFSAWTNSLFQIIMGHSRPHGWDNNGLLLRIPSFCRPWAQMHIRKEKKKKEKGKTVSITNHWLCLLLNMVLRLWIFWLVWSCTLEYGDLVYWFSVCAAFRGSAPTNL